MHPWRSLLAGVLAAAGLVLASPAPAQACSCVVAGPQQYLAMADVVFTGTLVATTPPPRSPVASSMDPVAYRFDVDEVYLGDPAAQEEVWSARWGASCGLEGMEEGVRYVVFAAREDISGERTDGWWASLCGGTQPASGRLVARIAELSGPPTTPANPTTDQTADPTTPWFLPVLERLFGVAALRTPLA